jgi:hypothetical protein
MNIVIHSKKREKNIKMSVFFQKPARDWWVQRADPADRECPLIFSSLCNGSSVFW